MSKKYKLMSAVGGAFFFCAIPAAGQAQCLMTQDCEALGYTEASCPDGGIKCPFGDKWACTSSKKDVCQSCYVGWILNSDMTCSYEKVSGKTPIGVVAHQTITAVGAAIKCQGVAVALSDLSGTMTWRNASSESSSYSAGGITGWHLPTKEELLAVYSKESAVSSGLTAAGGSQFRSSDYWSSSAADPNNILSCYAVNPVSGNTGDFSINAGRSCYVRPVLAFEN